MTATIDAARLTLLLNDLRLPAIKQDWAGFAERADKEAWPAARFLAGLAEHEIAERHRRRLARHLAEAQLLPGKTLDSFRRRTALGRKQKAGRPQSYATIKDLDTVSPSDNQPST